MPQGPGKWWLGLYRRRVRLLLSSSSSPASSVLADVVGLRRTLREHGVELVSVADGSRLSGWERQLAELAGAADEEVAD